MDASLVDIVSRIRQVGMYEKLISENKPEWEAFKKHFLLSIHIQKLYSELNHFFQGLTLHTRDLLVAYMLLYYEVDENTNTSIQESSKRLIECIHTEKLDHAFRSKLYHSFLQYQRVYIPWKLEDREKTLETLTNMYWEYEINWRLYQAQLTADERQLLQQEKDKRQEECIHTMKRIDNLTYFNQFHPVFVDSKTSTLLQEVLRKAFWDRMKQGLSADPPEFDPLFSIFKEIQEHLTVITRFRPYIVQEFKDIFDVEFIQQQQQHGTIPADFWIQRIYYLFNLLIQLDSIEREKQHHEKEESFTKQISNHVEDHISLCVDTLAYITTRILEIREFYEHVIGDSSIEK